METSLFFTFFAAFISLTIFLESSCGVDFLSPNQSITYPERIISAGGIFELGFFSPGNSGKYYLGIMYRSICQQNVVWVGNRDYAIQSSSATLSISSDGNIVIIDGRMSYKVTNISARNNTFAMILDTGNLILTDRTSEAEVYWQSFDYPTDTLLPGMNLGQDMFTGYSWSLVSWTREGDPNRGSFSLIADSSGLIIKQENRTYRKVSNGSFGIFITLSKRLNLKYQGYFTYYGKRGAISKVVLDVSGQLKIQLWSEDSHQWISLLPFECDSRLCGAYSSCNLSDHGSCNCLPGFGPRFPDAWIKGKTSDGCVRKNNLQCSSKDGFLVMEDVSFPSHPVVLPVSTFGDCRSAAISNCSFIAYALDDHLGCLVWDLELYDLVRLSNNDTRGRNFYLKLTTSELMAKDRDPGYKRERDTGNKRQLWIIVVLTLSLALLTLGIVIYYVRRKLITKGENLLLFDLGMNLEDDDMEYKEADKLGKCRKRETKFPLFSFMSISAATDNFSAANKLGEGGFGPVYKGKLKKGEEVAVKRLSRRSGQGWEELKNEALLIAKLQHKNLVRLLGCCIERDEKILIYEYMPNKSLDFFLFDPTKRRILDWGMRVRIIEGIAQGLLYLHQFSRLRIIHRDLKARNILLDSDMNPKISDFGMARMFGENELQANTERIVGTYGYMSPEYALEGLFSIKSDVFSFGVLLLEIVSGKKNTGFYQTASLNLIGYAWDIWTSGRPLDLMDPVLEIECSSTDMALRYVHIALLCVQDSAADRPTMFDVVSMLHNESGVLPSPKVPAFSNVRSTMNAMLPISMPEICSANNMTVTSMEAR